jgi:hypothetical protein
MADDPRGESDTEALPIARDAFETSREAREEDAAAVSRAAALLSLVRPPRLSMTQFRAVTVEARELLGVAPVEPLADGRSYLEEQLRALGPSGERAAEIIRSLERRREPDPGFGIDQSLPSSERAVMQDVRPRSNSERERIESEQSASARSLFITDASVGDAERQTSASRLVAASLLDRDPLVQVAAAAATLRLDPKNPLADAILNESSRGRSDQIAELSRAILATDREAETRRIEVEHPRGEPDPAADSAMVHGTWARWGQWWQPQGDLHEYLCVEEGLFPHLYRGRQPFEWSGYFSFRAWMPVKKDWHRQQAADSLAWWTHRKLVASPDLIGHSYGGSLALLATQAEKELRGLVLLSPALHRSCLPEPENYERILHVTVKLDLVLLADLSNPGLLRSFRDVTEWRMKRKGLLGHSATHDPHSWAASGLTDHVRDKWLPSLTARA